MMRILICGGSGSGKSYLAERLLSAFAVDRRIYLATMNPEGEEAGQRIARHQSMRAGKGFETVECYRDLAGLELPAGCGLLLECLGNLLAGEMFSPEGTGPQAAQTILAGMESLERQAKHQIIVTNEVGCDGVRYDVQTKRYQEQLGYLNRSLAANSDVVIEAAGGIPAILKGERKWLPCAL